MSIGTGHAVIEVCLYKNEKYCCMLLQTTKFFDCTRSAVIIPIGVSSAAAALPDWLPACFPDCRVDR